MMIRNGKKEVSEKEFWNRRKLVVQKDIMVAIR